MRRWGQAVLWAGAWLCSACGDDAAGPRAVGPREQGDARVGGRVVSTVDGVAITIEDVERAASAERIPPREALRRLQEDLLLAAEARRRGFDGDERVAADVRRAAVQAMLEAEVEAAVPESSIEDEAIARAYERHRDRFVAPERRASRHALARVGRDAPPEEAAAARARIEAFLGELRAAPDPLALLAARAGGPDLAIQTVPPLARDADAEPAYLEALFALPAPGLVPRAVRTGYGWHAILLTEIQPARNVDLAAATPELRRSLTESRRRAKVAELLQGIARRTRVESDPEAVRAALARDLDAP